MSAHSHTPLRRTKIVATLGPASDREGVLEAMLKAGGGCGSLELFPWHC